MAIDGWILLGSALFTALFLALSPLVMKRVVRQVEARKRAELRRLFITDRLPGPSERVEVLVDRDLGLPDMRTAWHWPGVGWVDAETLGTILAPVIGWRLRTGPGWRQKLPPGTPAQEELRAALARALQARRGDVDGSPVRSIRGAPSA